MIGLYTLGMQQHTKAKGLLARKNYFRAYRYLGSVTSVRHTATVGDLDDPGKATRGKTTWEVFRGWLVFKIFSYDVIVDNSEKLYRVSRRVLGARLVEKLLRLTAFGQFVSGTDETESKVTAKKWAEQGVTSIWYKSVERDTDEVGSAQTVEDLKDQEAFHDEVTDAYLRSVELAGTYNTVREPRFMSFKVTAIINPVLLSKLNTALVMAEDTFLSHASPGQYKIDRYIPAATLHDVFPTLQIKGHDRNKNVSLMDWTRHFCYLDNLDYFSQLKLPAEEELCFTDLEREQISKLIERLKKLGEAAESNNVTVLVDAEHRYFQKAIEHFTLHYFFKKYNGSTSPRFYNTVQTYLKDSFDTLLINEAAAKTHGVKLAVKLVRGCNMEHENSHAKALGVESPIHSSKADTDASYHRSLDYLMKLVHNDQAVILVASHNKETVRRALKLMEQYAIEPSDRRVGFGQQMGMADHLTLPLAQAGYQACKLVPYGSLDDIVPFLTRRANENRGIMKNARDERKLYFQELKRRLFLSGQ